ncbi:MAG: hypothetical protein IPP52_11580 [Ignavibacteria bacterium]|nr:hypothetical protein [Ignavibacteria bacterium]
MKSTEYIIFPERVTRNMGKTVKHNLCKNIKPKKSKLFSDLSFGISVKPQFGQYFADTDRNDLTITTNNNFEVRGTGQIDFLFQEHQRTIQSKCPFLRQDSVLVLISELMPVSKYFEKRSNEYWS